MRAARFYGAGDVRVEEIPEPEVGYGTVKLRVEWCGLCGTDAAEYRFGPLGTPVEPHPLTGETIPVVLGHELTGTVVDCGGGVTEFEAGERVFVEPTLRCGKCLHCKAGRYNICDFLGVHGLSGGGGGLSEYTVVPAYTLHRLPDGLDMGMATLAEPVAVALRAIRRSGVTPSMTTALFGAGPIGLILIACLRRLGVEQLAVVEPSARRRQLAVEAGATLAVAPDEAGDSQTHPVGFDVVFEASGVDQALAAAIGSVRAGGTVVLMARFKKPTTIDPNRLRREITLISTQAYQDEIPEALELVSSGVLGLDRIVTTRVSLGDVVSGGFEELCRQPAEVGKVLVDCRGG